MEIDDGNRYQDHPLCGHHVHRWVDGRPSRGLDSSIRENKMRYEVSLLKGNRIVRKELFANYESAMAFFDSSRDRFTCEFRDLHAYDRWRYRAA